MGEEISRLTSCHAQHVQKWTDRWRNTPSRHQSKRCNQLEARRSKRLLLLYGDQRREIMVIQLQKWWRVICMDGWGLLGTDFTSWANSSDVRWWECRIRRISLTRSMSGSIHFRVDLLDYPMNGQSYWMLRQSRRKIMQRILRPLSKSWNSTPRKLPAPEKWIIIIQTYSPSLYR
jgi:hypothetical protein